MQGRCKSGGLDESVPLQQMGMVQIGECREHPDGRHGGHTLHVGISCCR